MCMETPEENFMLSKKIEFEHVSIGKTQTKIVREDAPNTVESHSFMD